MKVQISTSATKKQISNAKLLFGAKGEGIIKKLEELSKEKLLDTKHIDGLLSFLKTATPEQVEKFAKSAGGKKTVAAFKKVAASKTMTAVFTSIKQAKLPASIGKQLLGGKTATKTSSSKPQLFTVDKAKFEPTDDIDQPYSFHLMFLSLDITAGMKREALDHINKLLKLFKSEYGFDFRRKEGDTNDRGDLGYFISPSLEDFKFKLNKKQTDYFRKAAKRLESIFKNSDRVGSKIPATIGKQKFPEADNMYAPSAKISPSQLDTRGPYEAEVLLILNLDRYGYFRASDKKAVALANALVRNGLGLEVPHYKNKTGPVSCSIHGTKSGINKFAEEFGLDVYIERV